MPYRKLDDISILKIEARNLGPFRIRAGGCTVKHSPTAEEDRVTVRSAER
jgi:hypothetical protein